ncbi:MAG: hypothetical protein IVZ94_07965 [Nitrospirae bacterium]|nr:hypothetical protein [Nitrospirota bacterium]
MKIIPMFMILDNENGKKHIERMELDYFIEAYEHSRGEKLVPVKAYESPDFYCQRADGTVIGLELTQIMNSLESEDMTGTEARDKLYESLERKKGLTTEKIILVLQLVGCPISELKYLLDESLAKDFGSYGFVEIWLADYTGIEAYGDIELFCLYPSEQWGYYQRQYPEQKPYG